MAYNTESAQVRCRTFGHSWFDYDSDWSPDYGVPMTLRCERCGMERRDAVQRTTGELLGRHYKQPDGYAYLSHSTPTRAEFRALLLDIREKEQTRKDERRVRRVQ